MSKAEALHELYGKRLIIPRVDCTLKIEYHMDDKFVSDQF